MVCLVCSLLITFITDHHASANPICEARTHATARRSRPATALRARAHSAHAHASLVCTRVDNRSCMVFTYDWFQLVLGRTSGEFAHYRPSQFGACFVTCSLTFCSRLMEALKNSWQQPI
eukprot:449642-Pleurochrysis_carterae.AAC.2